MSLTDRSEKLEVYGPPGTKERIETFLQIPYYTLTFEVQVRELKPNEELHREGYRIKTCAIEHVLPGLAYALIEDPRPGRFYPERAMKLGVKPGPDFSRLQAGESLKLPGGRIVKPEDVMGPPRPGCKIVYANDTRPSKAVVELARDADVLIHDCTLADELIDKAKESGHSTPTEAAKVAKEAGVRQLVLIHLSPRYADDSLLLEEARRIFPNVAVAKDLMELEVKPKD
jgi:ribonuclease Z